jgi:hypothetical protein
MTGGAIDFELIAYHEAGHVAGWRHSARAIFLERGYVLINAAGGQTGVSGLAPLIDHPTIVTTMAGRAAEAIRYPHFNRAKLEVVSRVSDEGVARDYIQVLYGGNLSEIEIIDRINAAKAEASQILRGVWAGVKALAETLLVGLKTPGDEAELSGAEALRVMDTAL